jgi:DNA-binding response OmpR family regulator
VRILLIEDDTHKATHISSHLYDKLQGDIFITTVRSYQSGLQAVMTEPWDVVLLDMSLPTYDITPTEDGYRFDAFAGRSILSEMKRKNVVCRVIVITQYNTLGEGQDRVTLDELSQQLKDTFPDSYKGAVYYSSSETNWKDALIALMGRT